MILCQFRNLIYVKPVACFPFHILSMSLPSTILRTKFFGGYVIQLQQLLGYPWQWWVIMPILFKKYKFEAGFGWITNSSNHFLAKPTILSMSYFKSCVAVAGVLTNMLRVVSSANRRIQDDTSSAQLLINKRNSRGPRTEPWGTTERIKIQLVEHQEAQPSIYSHVSSLKFKKETFMPSPIEDSSDIAEDHPYFLPTIKCLVKRFI